MFYVISYMTYQNSIDFKILNLQRLQMNNSYLQKVNHPILFQEGDVNQTMDCGGNFAICSKVKIAKPFYIFLCNSFCSSDVKKRYAHLQYHQSNEVTILPKRCVNFCISTYCIP